MDPIDYAEGVIDSEAAVKVKSIINSIYYLDKTRWLISLIENKIIILEKVDDEGKRTIARIKRGSYQNYSEAMQEDNLDIWEESSAGELLTKVLESESITLENPLTARIRSWRITREQYTNPPGISDESYSSEEEWAEKLLLYCGLSLGWEETFGEAGDSKALLRYSIIHDEREGVERALARNKEVKDSIHRPHTLSFFGGGKTSLMLALRMGRKSIVELLISKGASLTKKAGLPAKCALDIIEEEDFDDREKILKFLKDERKGDADISKWYIDFGELHEKMGMEGGGKVLRCYKMAYEIEPGNIVALSKLALSYSCSKQASAYEKVEEFCGKTLKGIEESQHNDEAKAIAWGNIGMCQFKIGRYEDTGVAVVHGAIYYLNLAIHLIEGKVKTKKMLLWFREVNLRCGDAYYKCDNKDAQAAKCYEIGISSYKKNSLDKQKLHQRMVFIYRKLGDEENARKHAAEEQKIRNYYVRIEVITPQ
jgi:hypothetical protein